MAGMKKSGAKKKSVRAIEQQQQRAAEEAKAKEAADKKARQKKKLIEDAKKMMFAMYGLIMAFISWLADYMGIFAAIGLILSIIGLRFSKKEEVPKYFWMAVGGIVLAGVRFVMEMYPIVKYFMGA